MPLMEDKSIEIEECIALRVKDGGDVDNIATFKAKNEKLGFELGYEFSGRVFPWMTCWTEHYARFLPPSKLPLQEKPTEPSAEVQNAG